LLGCFVRAILFSNFWGDLTLIPKAFRQVYHTMVPCHGAATANPQQFGVIAANRYGSPVKPSLCPSVAFLRLQGSAFLLGNKSLALRGKSTSISSHMEFLLVHGYFCFVLRRAM
jgi:hypothetical protein